MFTATFSFIFYTWTISLITQILGAIWILPIKSNPLVDKGWALGRIISWLAIGLVVWMLSFAGLPINTTVGVWVVICTFSIISIWQLMRQKSDIKLSLNSIKKFLITEEILFTIGLVFLSLIRSFNPHIQDLEKPMDAGFMASYLRSSTFPARDMWLSGESINYYSFGHFLGSIQTRILHLEITYTYNLMLALIMGLGLALSFSVVVNLLAAGFKPPLEYKKLTLAGVIGSLFVIVGGNSHTIWYLLKNSSWEGYWYADATRFIHNTIHEFPSYSFVVADIHAHVWDLPLVLSFLLVCIIWVRGIFAPTKKILKANSTLETVPLWIRSNQSSLVPAAFLGLFLGIFAMTSAWDAMIYSLFLSIMGLVIIVFDYRKLIPLILSGVTAIVVTIITILPWYLSFETITDGIALVTERSPLTDFLALWTGHLVISLTACIAAFLIIGKSKDSNRKINTLVILGIIFTAWVLLLLPEFIYFKDIYSGHPRANTMFKLTYQAFILMGLSGGWLMGIALLSSVSKKIKIPVIALVLIILGCFLTFPYFAYPGYYGQLKNFQGLHGYQWLQEKYPSDYAAIYWLQQNVIGQPTILEAVGESYTDFARVSSYTGMPTVLGWRVHEWLWRGGFDIPGQRTEEVRTMYEQPLSDQARELLDMYQVEYIFVGEKEYEAYPEMSVSDITKIGDIVYSNNRTLIIHRQLN